MTDGPCNRAHQQSWLAIRLAQSFRHRGEQRALLRVIDRTPLAMDLGPAFSLSLALDDPSVLFADVDAPSDPEFDRCGRFDSCCCLP